jgi:hypothetical protein
MSLISKIAGLNKVYSTVNKGNSVYLVPIAGLANRIRTINSSIELCKRISRPLKILWFKDDLLNCRFEELFRLTEPDVEVIEELEYKLLWCKPDSLSGADKLISKFFKRLFFSRSFYPDDLRRGINKPVFDSEKIISMMSGLHKPFIMSDFNYFPYKKNYLSFSPEISGRAEEISRTFGESVIGVHIRRSDHGKAIEFSPDEAFINKIKAELEADDRNKFFLATDSFETKQKFKALFGDKIISLDINLARNNNQGIKDALMELLLLSTTNKILGSYGSSFSETAAAIGNKKLEIIQ